MEILGFHILTDEQLTKKVQDARDWERGWANRIIVRLLGNNVKPANFNFGKFGRAGRKEKAG